MEDKYYTPEIEEFYIGFEFEYRHQGMNGATYGYIIDNIEYTLNGESDFTPWQKCNDFSEKFGDYNLDSITDLENYIKKNLVRVKYLDAEDIKEVGFRYVGYNRSSDYFEWDYKDYRLCIVDRKSVV